MTTISVCMITYNHEKYIREAIEGVLNQKTSYNIELVVSNDSSKDNTNNIIEEIITSHPKGNKIKYFNHEKNLGMMQNFIFALNKCQGKYIALCEGDDYWTDFFKLQKQIDFLDNNPDYAICFHPVKIFDENSKKFKNDIITRSVSETTTAKDLAIGNYMHTPSVVVRNNFTLSNWFSKVEMGDWSLYMLAVKDKKVKKINDVMGVYRLHGNSIWSNKSQQSRDRKTNKTVKLINKYIKSLPKDSREILSKREKAYYFKYNKLYRFIFIKLLPKIGVK